MSIAKAILASSSAERQWYEDQMTVNLYARRLLTGNARVIVIEGSDGSIMGLTLADLRDGQASLDKIKDGAGPDTYRVVEGSALFTPRDNARPFKAKPEAGI